MMNVLASPLLRGFRRLLVPLLLAISAGSANAVAYTGVWDPPFGAALPGLGWGGRAEFFVPDECVPSGDALIINVLPFSWGGCAGQARVTRAEVDLYDLTAPLNPALPRTLNFSTSFPSLSVIKLDYEDGDLEQLLTLPSNLVAAGFTDTDMGIGASTFFQLIFTFDGPRLSFWNCPTHTYSYASSSTSLCRFGGINDNQSFPPTFTITRVPEPATMWLAGIALLGMVSMRRRPRQ